MKSLFSLIFSVCMSTMAFSQLDSTNLVLSVVDDYVYPNDGLVYDGVLKMNLAFDDASDLDQIFIVVYTVDGNYVVFEQTLIAADLVSQGTLLNNQMEWPLMEVASGNNYRIELNFMNSSGAYTRSCEATIAY